MGELKKVLDRDQAANQGPSVPNAPVPNGGLPKILDTLKPKEPLSKEMNLEEANQWFKSYKAHLTYNSSTLVIQPISVQRAMLEVDLNLKMASALRSDKKVKDDTVIDAKDPTVSCLGTLRQIFLTKNPVWLRLHWYFCCMRRCSSVGTESLIKVGSATLIR